LNFPGVTLVGVILAEANLFLPDFKANERTYQLLSQVAGRAGRGDHPGEVIFQTYNPGHPCLICASDKDYRKFYSMEIHQRRALRYPPFSRVALARIAGESEEKVAGFARNLTQKLKERAHGTNLPASKVLILGPVPGPIRKVKKKYVWLVMIKAQTADLVHKTVEAVRVQKPGPGISVSIDMDANTIF
jgi:primosomal protein N' (replication factor Y)